MEQINVIQEKAAEAEAIVKAITTDIQRLDVAKRNLTGAIQTLERWDMLSMYSFCRPPLSFPDADRVEQANVQLKELLPTKRYKEMAQALSVSAPLLPLVRSGKELRALSCAGGHAFVRASAEHEQRPGRRGHFQVDRRGQADGARKGRSGDGYLVRSYIYPRNSSPGRPLMRDSFKNSPNEPPDLDRIKDVCLVIDVLGGDFR
jgi:hypothetical protein